MEECLIQLHLLLDTRYHHHLFFPMGWCPTYQKERSPYQEPYYLKAADGRRFRLDFDCKNCQMKVYAE